MIKNILHFENRVCCEFEFELKHKHTTLSHQQHLTQKLKKDLKQNFSVVSELGRDSVTYYLTLKASPSKEKNKEKYTGEYFEKNVTPQVEKFIKEAKEYLSDCYYKNIKSKLSKDYWNYPKEETSKSKKLHSEIHELEDRVSNLQKELREDNIIQSIKEVKMDKSIPDNHKDEMIKILSRKLSK